PQGADFERTSPRRGKGGKDFVGNALEQIPERGMCEPLLRLGWTRRQDAQAALVCLLDACEPERGLADASLALEHETGGAPWRLLDEGAEAGELLLPADDVYVRRPRRRRSCPASTGAG